MRYLPNLIPDKFRVLPDYFKGSVYHPQQPNSISAILSWMISIIFFIAAIAMLNHPALTLLLGIIGFILLPPAHRWIERVLQFQMTNKIKGLLCAVLLFAVLPLKSYYKTIDIQEENELNFLAKKTADEKLIAEKKDTQRKDSLAYHLLQSQVLQKEHKSENALKKLEYAMTFASTEEEKKLISEEQVTILAAKAIALVKTGNYKKALPELTTLISKDTRNSDLLYNRAVCYNKTGKTQDAVTDLETAIKLGNKDAEKLYEKINPIKKRITGYVTRCCDGSTSNSSGSGACSHHGGVCNWNEPIYEEYRKY
jgi:tetratricopeptide (TPR) repeat protein